MAIYNNFTGNDLQEAYFNGTYFGAITFGNTVTKTVTSGNYNVYVQVIGVWFRCSQSLNVNPGASKLFTITGSTEVTVVSGPGASIKGNKAQHLRNLLKSTK